MPEWSGLQIPVTDLRLVFDRILQHVEHANGESVVLREDYFYSLPAPGLYDVSSDLDVLSGTFVLTGIAVIVGNASSGDSTAIWIGVGLILMGAVCWGATILLPVRAAKRGPRNPSR